MIDPPAFAGDPDRLRAKAELDAVLPVGGGEEFRGHRTYDAAHHPVGQFEDPDRLALTARDRREFEADKAGADDHDMLGGGEPLAQLVGFSEVAQITDAVELDPRQRRDAIACAGRQHEVVVAELFARGEAQLPPGAVDLGRPRARQVVDAVIAIERLRPHQQQIEADLALEVILGEGRALIGQHRLLTEQHDRAVETALAQRGGELKPGMPGPDDDYGFLCHYP